MKKKIISSAIAWIFLLACISILFFFVENTWMFIAATFWGGMPFATWGMNFFTKGKITTAIVIPSTMSKKKCARANLIVTNNSWIPVSKMYGSLQVKNQLTGESHEEILEISAPGKSKETWSFEIYSEYCGYLRITVKKVYLMDWIGFLPIVVKGYGKGSVVIVPDTFSPTVCLRVSPAQKEDAQAWSEQKKGADQTEVFSLREYVSGDSLKKIHWKLSSKRQQLIVKEASLPVEKSLLIFWDKNVGKRIPKEMDAFGECVASVAQEIFSQGVLFTIGWTEGSDKVFEDISNEEELLHAISKMMKWGCSENDVTKWDGYQDKAGQSFGKVIYIGKNIPEAFSKDFFQEMTFIQCGCAKGYGQWPVVSFEADTYLEDLETIQL